MAQNLLLIVKTLNWILCTFEKVSFFDQFVFVEQVLVFSVCLVGVMGRLTNSNCHRFEDDFC